MSISVGSEIGLEMHEDTDQFLRIEAGKVTVKMESRKNKLNFQKCVSAGDAIFVPADTWHNIINTGQRPLKVYSIYAPQHPLGTVHKTKTDADKSEY